MIFPHRQSGFTAIELLITLFVAAGFLVAGYQLFNVIIKDGGQARAESRAGNVAYDYIRRYTSYATNPCVAQTPVNNASVSIDSLSNAVVTVAITCPQYSTPSISKIEVTLIYNTPQQTVKYGTLVNGSSTQVADITDGLVGWWKLNGNANSSVGSINGTVSNATTTTGQNGQADTAYAFNGSSSSISLPSNFNLGITGVSLSMWVKPTAASGSGAFMKISGAGYGIGLGNTNFENTSPGTKIVMLYEAVRWIPTTQDLGTGWHHVVMVIDTSGTPSLYKDGTFVGSYPGSNAIMGTSPSYIGYGQIAARYFDGSIDDVRIYSRVLSADEISTLYSGGAK
jgi:prepilin-type N-terminal cleavage/methylation domain-containing protein